ncbi:MAG: tetratricopeptide (TPR) repeat protein [Bacteroidia bacterium]|jgi:tetratricopeptide (TPR) repeat protein
MGNIRNQNFKRAIINFEKCYAYFSKHPFLDKYGLIFLLNTGDIDYKLSSLLNQAFCHKMLGNHSKSTSIYENVLSLYPKNKVATLGLAMIKAEQNEHK